MLTVSIELEQRAHELAGQPFDLNSPQQVAEIFDRLGIPAVTGGSDGALAIDDSALSKLAQDYALPKVLIEYRRLAVSAGN